MRQENRRKMADRRGVISESRSVVAQSRLVTESHSSSRNDRVTRLLEDYFWGSEKIAWLEAK